MLKSGEIVVQEYTMVNNKNYKDNKKNRLSVVVFEDVTENGSVVYTCPITNGVKTALYNKDKYCYFPFLVLDDVKYSCIKLDSLNRYSSDIVHPVGINLDDAHIELMFDKILNSDFSTNRDDVFKEVKEKILLIKDDIKRQKKEEKRARKLLVKMKRREAKRGVNY